MIRFLAGFLTALLRSWTVSSRRAITASSRTSILLAVACAGAFVAATTGWYLSSPAIAALSLGNAIEDRDLIRLDNTLGADSIVRARLGDRTRSIDVRLRRASIGELIRGTRTLECKIGCSRSIPPGQLNSTLDAFIFVSLFHRPSVILLH